MGKRLTRRECRALAEAAGFRLAGDPDDDDFDTEALESAHRKVSARGWPVPAAEEGEDASDE